MAFDRFHPDPRLQHNLRNARDLRAEYLRALLGAFWRRIKAARTAVSAESAQMDRPPKPQG
jgi:hypothetical protein